MQHHFVNPRRPPAHYLSYRGARKSHHPPAVSILILALSFLALAIAAYYCLRMPAAYTMRVEAKRAELRVIEYVGGIPVAGTCTACPDVVFHTGSKLGRVEDHQRVLVNLFVQHWEKVHLLDEFKDDLSMS